MPGGQPRTNRHLTLTVVRGDLATPLLMQYAVVRVGLTLTRMSSSWR